MEFDKNRVFTSLNTDEVKIGSKVICANDLNSLKIKVSTECDISKLKGVFDESHERRFQVESRGAWPLIYLISEPEEKKLKWTDLKIGDVIYRKGISCMITGIDPDDDTLKHVCFNNCWQSDQALEDWEKVE